MGNQKKLEPEVYIGAQSGLFYETMNAAINAGLLPKKETGSLDGNTFMKWYNVFTGSLHETSRKDNWPVKFRTSR